MKRLSLIALLAFAGGFVLASCGPSRAEIYCTKITSLAQDRRDTMTAEIACMQARDAEITQAQIAIGTGVAAGMAASAGARR